MSRAGVEPDDSTAVTLVADRSFPKDWNNAAIHERISVRTPAANLPKALMKISIAALLLTISVLSSCASGSTGPDFSDGGFSVDARPGYLRLTNETPARVHYVALEAETATRVNLTFDSERWPSVPPHGELQIPNAELMGYEPDARQAFVYWWTKGEHRRTALVDLR